MKIRVFTMNMIEAMEKIKAMETSMTVTERRQSYRHVFPFL